jgi:hypothetical protein
MGKHLRSALGRDLVIIGGTSGVAPTGKDSAEVDSALSRVGMPRFLLDVRAADAAALSWLSERRTIRANETTAQIVTASSAFDALYYVDRLTAARH